MIPHASSALTMLSRRLLQTVVPDLKSTYTMSDGSMTAMLLTTLVPELEHGIERRRQDIEGMKNIFRLAKETLDADRLPRDLTSALTRKPASMRLSDVNALHDALTNILIELHTMVDDQQPSKVDAIVNAEIWRYLGDHLQRHHVELP